MKKFLVISLCLLFCFGFLFAVKNVANIKTNLPSHVVEAQAPAFQGKAGKKTFALDKLNAKVKNNQTLKVLFNNKTFLLDLKKYEIYSPVHTTKLSEQKFARHGSLDEKIAEVEKLVDSGLSLKDSFNIVCPKISNDILKIYNSVNCTPKNATIKFNTNLRKFNFTEDKVGYEISEDDCYNLIFNAYKSKKTEIKLTPKVLEPTYRLNELKKCVSVRGSFETNFSSSTADRKHNIKLALKNFNGLTLMPGETISFNNITGPRTEQTGYKTAKVILNGVYTDGTGGGVCQASTTLYNACLVSDVEVLSSAPHTLPASYVKPGFDAMVAYGSSDLVIKNTTDGAITFETIFNNSTFKIKVYGLSLQGTKVELTSEVIEEYEPLSPTTVSAIEKGVEQNTLIRPAFKGFAVQTYALYKNGDKIVKTKKIRLSRYKSQSEVVAV